MRRGLRAPQTRRRPWSASLLPIQLSHGVPFDQWIMAAMSVVRIGGLTTIRRQLGLSNQAGSCCVQAHVMVLRARWHRGVKTHAAAAALLLLLTALFAVLLALDSRRSHAARRALWLSVLMGALWRKCCSG
jgi:hypothetical protein